jgi:hypothetical protein
MPALEFFRNLHAQGDLRADGLHGISVVVVFRGIGAVHDAAVLHPAQPAERNVLRARKDGKRGEREKRNQVPHIHQKKYASLSIQYQSFGVVRASAQSGSEAAGGAGITV